MDRDAVVYVLKRVGQSILVLFLAYVLVFVILTVLPGDPISNKLADPDSGYSPAEIAMLTEYYGLDRPFLEQFWDSITKAFQGDFGISLVDAVPVEEKIAAALPSTVQLAAAALLIAVLVALGISLLAVYAPWAWLRAIGHGIPSLLQSVPSFILALILLQVFAFQLGWFHAVLDEGPKSLVLPAVALGIPVSATLAQVFTTNLLQSSKEPFALVARSKGLTEGRIFRRHLLKPSSLPAFTVLGLMVGGLLGGAVITETIYGRYGLGRLVEISVAQQDLPVLQGVVILAAAIYLGVNLLVDLVYPLLNPRVSVREVRA